MARLREHEEIYIKKMSNLHEYVDECDMFGCVIHNPTDHSMRDFALNWRNDRGLMERICSHGVGHPDPDHMNWYERTHEEDATWAEGVHGCDGCCAAS